MVNVMTKPGVTGGLDGKKLLFFWWYCSNGMAWPMCTALLCWGFLWNYANIRTWSTSATLYLLPPSGSSFFTLLFIPPSFSTCDWPFPHGCDNLRRNNVGEKKRIYLAPRVKSWLIIVARVWQEHSVAGLMDFGVRKQREMKASAQLDPSSHSVWDPSSCDFATLQGRSSQII